MFSQNLEIREKKKSFFFRDKENQNTKQIKNEQNKQQNCYPTLNFLNILSNQK